MAASIALAAPDLTGREREYLLQAFDSTYLTHAGEWEARFEKEFSRWIERPSIAVSSGTAALHLALLALGIGRGDEVICPVLTFGATASVIVQVGAVPKFIDLDDSWGLNWEHVKRALTKRTRAIIAVHLYGERCTIPQWIEHPIIEDACEALGMVKPERDLACFSFYGNKPMTTGEGGMLCGAYGRARSFRDGGFERDYDMTVPGLNYRMTNLQAAIGCAQLERVDGLVERRLRNASRYAESLTGRGKWLFVAETSDPSGLARKLRDEGIDTRPVFKPLNLTQAFRHDVRYRKAESIWERGLCLPTGPHVGVADIERICGIVKDYG